MIKKTLWAVALLAAAVTVVVNLTIARLPAMPPADGTYISLRGKEIHYVERPGTGTPVMMLHGLPGTHKDFDLLIAKMPGAHTFAIDRPGFGWSRGGWMPFADQIDLVHDFLTQRGASPAILVGWSFGGSLALGVAQRYPQDVAKLILVAPAGGGMRSHIADLLQARYLQFSQLPVVKSIVKHTFGNIALRLSTHFGVRNAFHPGTVDADYQVRLLSVTATPGNLDALRHEQLEYDQTMQWLDDNVTDIRVPTVVIAARDDTLAPFEHVRRLVDTVPGAELITVDGSHMIPYTHPDAVVGEIHEAEQSSAAGQ